MLLILKEEVEVILQNLCVNIIIQKMLNSVVLVVEVFLKAQDVAEWKNRCFSPYCLLLVFASDLREMFCSAPSVFLKALTG